MKNPRCWRIALSAVALLAVLAGCSKKESPQGTAAVVPDVPAYGDAIVEGSIGDVSGFLSAVTSDSASHAAAAYMFNGLVRYDKDLKLEGVLAESWDISAEGKKITFHLRKDVKWQDGPPFTSADVMFTYQRMIDPKTPTAYGDPFHQVTRAAAPDPHTFVAEYAKPFAPALESWGMDILPKHLLEMYPDISKSPLNKHPVGTGPYRFIEWKTGEKLVFDANPDYFEGKPYIARVITRIIPDQATMFLELISGGLDSMNLTPPQYARQTDTPDFRASFNKYKYTASAYTYLGFRLAHPVFGDRRVRQAIAYASDKKALVDGVLLGLGQEATGPYKPGTWASNPDVRKYPHDPERARELLAEAGWKEKGRDGVLVKDGRRFEFTVLTNAGNEARSKTAAILQQNLSEVGIRMQIRTVEWAAFINQFIDKRDFEAVILGWSISPDPDQFTIWHSSMTGPKQFNFVGFENPEVDRLLEEGRGTFDLEKRKKAYFRIQEILAEEQPYVFLYVPDALPVVQSRFHGIRPALAGISHNFIKWYVPKPLQKHRIAP